MNIVFETNIWEIIIGKICFQLYFSFIYSHFGMPNFNHSCKSFSLKVQKQILFMNDAWAFAKILSINPIEKEMDVVEIFLYLFGRQDNSYMSKFIKNLEYFCIPYNIIIVWCHSIKIYILIVLKNCARQNDHLV